MRTSARAAAAALLVAVLARAAAGALGPVYGGRLSIHLPDLPARFDAAPAHGSGARLVAALVHEELVELREGAPEPALARSWASAAGGREWTLRLRENAVFHDGTAIEAGDVVRSLRRFLRSSSPAARGLALRLDGAGIAASDPLTVVVRVREPSPSLLSYLAAPAAAITSARGAGAGPFVPTTASPIRGSAAFVTFRGHVRGRPFLDGLTVHAGDTGDGPADVSPVVGSGPLAGALLLVLDPADRLLSRADVRRAVAAAIDRDDLVRNFVPGGVTIDSPLPALFPGVRPGPAPRPRRSIAGAMTLAVAGDVPAVVSQRVVASLGAAGLRVSAREASPGDVWTAPASARLIAWTPEVADPLLALEELADLARWSRRGLLARAAGEEDRDRRAALLQAAEAALRAHATIVPLAGLRLGHRARPGVHGIAVDGAGRIRLEDAWIAP